MVLSAYLLLLHSRPLQCARTYKKKYIVVSLRLLTFVRSNNAAPIASMDPDGIVGEYPPPPAHTSSHSSTTEPQTGGEDPLRPGPVILRILPANNGDMAGYIRLAYNEIIHQSALVAYFNNACQAVDVIPVISWPISMIVNAR